MASAAIDTIKSSLFKVMSPSMSPILSSSDGHGEIEALDLNQIEEPMLKENPNRFVIFPIEHKDLWDMYKKHMAVFWTAEEIDLSKDMEHWNGLSDNERHFIKYIL